MLRAAAEYVLAAVPGCHILGLSFRVNCGVSRPSTRLAAAFHRLHRRDALGQVTQRQKTQIRLKAQVCCRTPGKVQSQSGPLWRAAVALLLPGSVCPHQLPAGVLGHYQQWPG